jgi:DNA-binding NarL/FixJ family response regulator
VIRVVIVDDQHLVRTGFQALLSLNEDIIVVGQGANGFEACQLAASARPDVVVMDIRMPAMDGIEATQRITAAGSLPRVIILTTFDVDELVHSALRAGASGFMLKDAPPEELAHAIRVVHSGDAPLAPSVTRRLLDRFATEEAAMQRRSGAEDLITALTDREREVLTLIAKGLSNSEIAEATYVAESTVKTHVSRVFMKIGARDRVQAVITAYTAGLVE